jgi:hypothetical protein
MPSVRTLIELRDAEGLIKILKDRLADERLLAGQEPDTIGSWRRELSELERRALLLQKQATREG